MKVKYLINTDPTLNDGSVIDFGVISRSPFLVGLIYDHHGVLICQFTDYDVLSPQGWSPFTPQIDCVSSNTS